MLKNISNNVKCQSAVCQKFYFTKNPFSATFFFFWIVMKPCKCGQFNSPVLSIVPLLYPKMKRHSSDHTHTSAANPKQKY